METTELHFKTNLNCGGCVAKVQSDLDQAQGIETWQVDTDNPAKILTVKSTGITADQIIELVERKGFQAERLS